MERLNEDFKDSNIDYTIEEEKKWWQFYNYFIEKHPRDFIPIFLYEKITKLVEEAFLNEMEEIIVNTDYNFDIKYPNYLDIINNINKNFNELPQNNFSLDKKIVIIAVFSIVVFAIVCLICYFVFCKKNNKDKNQNNPVELDEQLENDNEDNEEGNNQNKQNIPIKPWKQKD